MMYNQCVWILDDLWRCLQAKKASNKYGYAKIQLGGNVKCNPMLKMKLLQSKIMEMNKKGCWKVLFIELAMSVWTPRNKLMSLETSSLFNWMI